MSAAANAAGFLSLRGRLQQGFLHHQPRVVPAAVIPAEPRPAPAESTSTARAVRVTYRRGRLAGSS